MSNLFIAKTKHPDGRIRVDDILDFTRGVQNAPIYWHQIQNKPSVFPPEPHTHPWGEITDKPSTYPPDPHQHTKTDIIDLEQITTTPTPNAIPKANSSGKLDSGWIDIGGDFAILNGDNTFTGTNTFYDLRLATNLPSSNKYALNCQPTGGGMTVSNIPAEASLTKDFSIELWYKKNQTNAVAYLYRSYFSPYGIILYEYNSKFKVVNYGIEEYNFNVDVPADTDWHHVVFVFDKSKGKMLFLDGELKETIQDYTDFGGQTGGEIRIGTYSTPSSYSIDEVRVYQRPLTEEEVAYLYNNGNGRYYPLSFFGLVAWWHFDEGEGTTAYDSGPLGLHGTLVGNATWAEGIVEKSDTAQLMFNNDCIYADAIFDLTKMPFRLGKIVAPVVDKIVFGIDTDKKVIDTDMRIFSLRNGGSEILGVSPNSTTHQQIVYQNAGMYVYDTIGSYDNRKSGIFIGRDSNGQPQVIIQNAGSYYGGARIILYTNTNNETIIHLNSPTDKGFFQVKGSSGVTNNAFFFDMANNFIGAWTTAPNSRFHIAGSVALSIATKTSDYTATATDCVILVNASTGDKTITLPSASGIQGRVYMVKKDDIEESTKVIIQPSTGNIDGFSNYYLTKPGESVILISDGNNWKILAKYEGV